MRFEVLSSCGSVRLSGLFQYDGSVDDAHCSSLHLGSSVNQLLSFSEARAVVINDCILDVAGRVPEEVENGDPIIRMYFSERVVSDPDSSQIGQSSEPRGFHGIAQFVVLHVQVFQ